MNLTVVSREIICIKFLSQGFASSSGSNQSWNKQSLPKRETFIHTLPTPQLRDHLETGTGGLGGPLPSFKMAIRKRALSGHMTLRARQAPRACAVRRGCEALGRRAGGGEAPPAPPGDPLERKLSRLRRLGRRSRGSRQVKRAPCRSGSGAATCAPTAAGLVSDAGAPAGQALLVGTPGGAVPAGGSLTAAQSPRLSGRRGARDRPGPVSDAAQDSLPPAARVSTEAEGPGRDGTGQDRQPRKAK